MSRKVIPLLIVVAMMVTVAIGTANAEERSTRSYGDVTLTSVQADHFPEVWDLTACDLTLSFTYDATGMVDDLGSDAHAWSQLGLRAVGYADYNPTWMEQGAGVWFISDYDWIVDTFDPDPDDSPSLDIDDKIILQRGGGMDEGAYDLPSTPPNPGANHAVWFDRDGVDQWQAQLWGAIDGVTYNTGGTYDVIITLHATGDSTGDAYMTVNGEPQGFYDPNWHPGPANLMPAGMTFSGDVAQMQVFYGLYGYGATHTTSFQNINVTGCIDRIPVDIDIKPGSYPNSINLRSRGVMPVAIYSTSDFDATQVDPATVFLAGAPVAMRGNKYLAHVEDVNGDGLPDLLLHMETGSLDPSAFQDGYAVLTGLLYEGTPVIGSDEITIVP